MHNELVFFSAPKVAVVEPFSAESFPIITEADVFSDASPLWFIFLAAVTVTGILFVIRLILGLTRTLIPKTFAHQVRAGINRSAAFKKGLLRYLFPILPIFYRGILVSKTNNNVSATILFHVVGRFLAHNDIVHVHLILRRLRFTLRTNSLNVGNQSFTDLHFRRSSFARRVIVHHAILRPQASLRFIWVRTVLIL